MTQLLYHVRLLRTHHMSISCYHRTVHVWARQHYRISPSSFLAECRKSQLNQGSFVLLCFALFAFSGLCLVSVLSVFLSVFCLVFSSVNQRGNGTIALMCD